MHKLLHAAAAAAVDNNDTPSIMVSSMRFASVGKQKNDKRRFIVDRMFGACWWLWTKATQCVNMFTIHIVREPHIHTHTIRPPDWTCNSLLNVFEEARTFRAGSYLCADYCIYIFFTQQYNTVPLYPARVRV